LKITIPLSPTHNYTVLQNKIFGLSHERDQSILLVWDSQNTNPLTVDHFFLSHQKSEILQLKVWNSSNQYLLIPFKIDEKNWNSHHRQMLPRATSGNFFRIFRPLLLSENEVWSEKNVVQKIFSIPKWYIRSSSERNSMKSDSFDRYQPEEHFFCQVHLFW